MEISLQDISKTFGFGSRIQPALRGVSFTAASGEIFGILGPNGAGKSTATRIMLGILQADSGQVLVDGGRICVSDELFRSSVGFLPEERAIYKTWRVKDVLAYFGLMKGMSRRLAYSRAAEYIEMLDLKPYWNTCSEKLSKGLSQRVQLITTFIHEPQLLIVDEPFSGLDPVSASTLRSLFMNFRERGRTIIVCSHQMKEVEALCDQVVLLVRGRVALSGRVKDICIRPDGEEIFVTGAPPLPDLLTAAGAQTESNGQRVSLRAGQTLHTFMAEIAERNIPIQSIEQARQSLEEVFVRIVQEHADEPA